jgi:type II restriction/modification system DNA methylase subunit YeeA
MNKSALKKFAIDARNELREKVQLKALQYGISEDAISSADVESSDAIFIEGRKLSKVEQKQRNKLIEEIKQKGFNQVVEEVSYTWFNRFTALRYMEVHDYIPTRVRVLSSIDEGSYEPDIIKEALNIDLDIDKEYVYALKISNDNDATEKLFEYLIIQQCNALNNILPGMFESINDYTMLLFPDKLLNSNSFVRVMTDTSNIPEEDWNDIEIIGWLYQYYNVEPKAKVDAYVGKKKVPKEDVPAKTQLFTPDWIVKYMVENSVGRLWLEGHPNDSLKENWKYYLDEAPQEPDTLVELEKIRDNYKNIKLEELKVFDPCMGSGHILVYAFEVLMQIYKDNGYLEREAASSIIENNLYGIDIDDRAYQLAYFAVMMKGRKYDRRFLSRKVNPNLCSIQESNALKSFEYGAESINLDSTYVEMANYVINQFRDAKEYGSIIEIDEYEYDGLLEYIDGLKNKGTENIFINLWLENMARVLPHLINQAKLLSNRYEVVITNPPYFSSSDMSPKLSEFVKKRYPKSKSDMFAVFIEKCLELSNPCGLVSMITMHSWMFLSSYEKLRSELKNYNMINMIHLGAKAFAEISGEIVQTTSFVYRNKKINDYNSSFVRLVEYKSENGKKKVYLDRVNKDVCYNFKQENYKKISGMPMAYWISDKLLNIFSEATQLKEIAEPKVGLQTGNNDKFLRLWHEVQYIKIRFDMTSCDNAIKSGGKWYPYNKGGSFRRWYGNREYLVNWKNDGDAIKNCKDENGRVRSRPQNRKYYFNEAITWSDITSASFSGRYCEAGFIFDVKGSSGFPDKDKILYVLGFLNSYISQKCIKILNPTVTTQVGDMARIPVLFENSIKEEVDKLVSKNISISKEDWNSYETSWEFNKHPLLKYKNDLGDKKCVELYIKDFYNNWKKITDFQFDELKKNEEKLNSIFIDLYDMNQELEPYVEDTSVTIRKAEIIGDIKSFISYAVGCMFGRYNLDSEGLSYAGGKWDNSKYSTFIPDPDNCIPITEDKYFEDDIVGCFVQFVEVVYGKETLEENLIFIADALENKGDTSREVIRNYFLKDFYKDHVKTYQKRPIYWLFDSGKNNGMKVPIYMHRYDENTLSRIRTDYLHVIQTRMVSQRQSLIDIIGSNESIKEKKNAEKELKLLDKKIQELKEYDEVLHHMADQQIKIDLDDGVKHNYNLFDGLLAKVPRLTKK